MTLRQFRLFVALWCLLAVPIMGFALYLAAVPWTRTGSPPGYALSLVGAPDARLEPRCRLVVFVANGRRSEVVTEAPCGTRVPALQTSGTAEADLQAAGPHGPRHADIGTTTRRLASALHSTIAVGGGVLACWLLMAWLRLLMRRRGPGSWVRRVAA